MQIIQNQQHPPLKNEQYSCKYTQDVNKGPFKYLRLPLIHIFYPLKSLQQSDLAKPKDLKDSLYQNRLDKRVQVNSSDRQLNDQYNQNQKYFVLQIYYFIII